MESFADLAQVFGPLGSGFTHLVVLVEDLLGLVIWARVGGCAAWIGCASDALDPFDRDVVRSHLSCLSMHLVVTASHPRLEKGECITRDDVSRDPSKTSALPALQGARAPLNGHGFHGHQGCWSSGCW